MPCRLEKMLQPGETVVYRAKPAWRAVAVLLAGGLGFVGAMHVSIGILDDNWYCPASLLWLAILTPFGIAKLSAAGETEAIITDRRVLCAQRRSDDRGELLDTVNQLAGSSNERADLEARVLGGPMYDVEELARSEIKRVDLVDHEIPIAAVRITGRGGHELELKLAHDPEGIRDLLLVQDTIPLWRRETARGAALVVVGLTCAAFMAFMTFFGVSMLLASVLFDPLWNLLGNPEDTHSGLLKGVIAYPLGFLLAAPILALAGLGALLGYLPALAISRFVVSFEEARVMALYLRKRLDRPTDEEEANFLGRWFGFWLRPAGRLCTWLSEGLVGGLFGRTIRLEERPAA